MKYDTVGFLQSATFDVARRLVRYLNTGKDY